MTDVRNTDDVIDSRDVIARIEELEEERQDLVEALDDARDTLGDAKDDTSAIADNPVDRLEAEERLSAAKVALSEWDADNGDELKALRDLMEEAGSSPDWEYGESLIRDSYFTEYAQQLLEDCGELPPDLPSYIEIDWEATARNLRVDYFSVDFDGVTYWIRA